MQDMVLVRQLANSIARQVYRCDSPYVATKHGDPVFQGRSNVMLWPMRSECSRWTSYTSIIPSRSTMAYQSQATIDHAMRETWRQ